MKSNLARQQLALGNLEGTGPVSGFPVRATLLDITEAGELRVDCPAGTWTCDLLVGPAPDSPWTAGDLLLVVPPGDGESAVVLGRIGRYKAPHDQRDVTIQASRSLTLKCGEASIDLRADGKVMIRGEDVLLRAKGTQRIRAGTVSIN